MHSLTLSKLAMLTFLVLLSLWDEWRSQLYQNEMPWIGYTNWLLPVIRHSPPVMTISESSQPPSNNRLISFSTNCTANGTLSCSSTVLNTNFTHQRRAWPHPYPWFKCLTEIQSWYYPKSASSDSPVKFFNSFHTHPHLAAKLSQTRSTYDI